MSSPIVLPVVTAIMPGLSRPTASHTTAAAVAAAAAAVAAADTAIAEVAPLPPAPPPHRSSSSSSSSSSSGNVDPGHSASHTRPNADVAEEDERVRRGLQELQSMKSRLLPKPAQEALHTWFNDHLSNPYPSKDDVLQLMCQTSLTETQIGNWFANTRRRNRNLINLAEPSVRRLQQWFNEHLLHPYPSDADLQRLARECSMALQVVSSWIQQARHLNRDRIREAMESVEQERQQQRPVDDADAPSGRRRRSGDGAQG
jgi:uncharacterized protein YacL (UPF0231 family)